MAQWVMVNVVELGTDVLNEGDGAAGVVLGDSQRCSPSHFRTSSQAVTSAQSAVGSMASASIQ